MQKITGKSVWQNADPYLEEKLSTTKIIALEKSIESALEIYAKEYANQFKAGAEADAIEFAEWLQWHGWGKILETGNEYWTRVTGNKLTTKELYQIFKSK